MTFVPAIFGVALLSLTVSTAASSLLLRDPRPDTGDEAFDLHIHDPSRIIRSGAHDVIAVTGKEQTQSYDCGLELWTRPTGKAGPWQPADCLLRSKPQWTAIHVPGNGGAYWAPDFVNETTILYSAASDFADGGPSCLGLIRRMEDGAWRDHGKPLSCTRKRGPSEPEVSIIDPAFFQAANGRGFIVTGGGTIHIAQIDLGEDDLGIPPLFPGPGWTALARGPALETGEHSWIEAASLHERSGTYYLFVNWGACCTGADSTYEVRVGKSLSPFGPFLDQQGQPMMNGFGTLVLEGVGTARGPGHPSIRSESDRDILSFHYYDARRGGLPWLGEVALEWKNGWPSAAPFAQ